MDLRDIATEFVSNEFFCHEGTIFNFLDIVIRRYNEALSSFRMENGLSEKDVFFIFKGGNILRVVSREFFLEIPENASRQLVSHFRPFFKRSDADFSIMLNPNIKNYEFCFRKLVILAYEVQMTLRGDFQENSSKYFDFFRYNERYTKRILTSLKDNLGVSSISILNNSIGNISYEKPRDYLYIGLGEFGKKKDKEGDRNEWCLYTSINEGFNIISETGWKTRFSLVRTKVRFNVVKDIKHKVVDGELIDVTIPRKESGEIIPFFSNTNENISKYTLTKKNKKLSFESYSLHYLIKDLEKILFYQQRFPWDDPKYTKRLHRLIFFYFIDIFSKIEKHEDRINTLNGLLRNLDSRDKKVIREDIDFSKLEKQVIRLNKEKKIDVEKFSEMKDVIRGDINFVIETLNNIKYYCSIDGIITNEDILESDIESYI